MVLEVEGVDAGLSMEAGEAEAALNSAAITGFQFEIDQASQGSGEAKVLRCRLLQGRFQMLAQGQQLQLFELLFQGSHGIPFGRPG